MFIFYFNNTNKCNNNTCLWTFDSSVSTAQAAYHLLMLMIRILEREAYLHFLVLIPSFLFMHICRSCALFEGASAELREATANSVMSVRPSTWSNSAPTRRISMKFDI